MPPSAKGGSGTSGTTFQLRALLEVVENSQSHISSLPLVSTRSQWNYQGSHHPGTPWRPLPACLYALAQRILFYFQAREQDVSSIIQALNECLAALPQPALRKVCGIGVSGQMHGVMFWKTGQGMMGSGDNRVLTITVEEKSAAQGCLKGQVTLQWG